MVFPLSALQYSHVPLSDLSLPESQQKKYCAVKKDDAACSPRTETGSLIRNCQGNLRHFSPGFRAARRFYGPILSGRILISLLGLDPSRLYLAFSPDLYWIVLLFPGLTDFGEHGFAKIIPLYAAFCLLATFINTAVQLTVYPASYADMFYINCFFPSEQPVFHQISLALGNGWGHLAYLLASCLGAFFIHHILKFFARKSV